MNTVQLGIRIPKHLNQRLLDYAAQTGISKTEIVISALARYFGTTNDTPLAEKVTNLEKKVAMLEAAIFKSRQVGSVD
ncbi:MAG: DNA-binding domain-containing protein [Nostoc indistinguendum CM1-VF10]|jgi:predicted DNA-binding protein|nr:DNA-binding domain-containing protein [Nostoc indistinguendum CM1-VF10]